MPRVRRDLRQKRTGQTAAVTPRPPPSIWEQKKACVRGELSGSVKGLVGNFGGNHGFSGVYPINPLVKAEWEFPAICQKTVLGYSARRVGDRMKIIPFLQLAV